MTRGRRIVGSARASSRNPQSRALFSARQRGGPFHESIARHSPTSPFFACLAHARNDAWASRPEPHVLLRRAEDEPGIRVGRVDIDGALRRGDGVLHLAALEEALRVGLFPPWPTWKASRPAWARTRGESRPPGGRGRRGVDRLRSGDDRRRRGRRFDDGRRGGDRRCGERGAADREALEADARDCREAKDRREADRGLHVVRELPPTIRRNRSRRRLFDDDSARRRAAPHDAERLTDLKFRRGSTRPRRRRRSARRARRGRRSKLVTGGCSPRRRLAQSSRACRARHRDRRSRRALRGERGRRRGGLRRPLLFRLAPCVGGDARGPLFGLFLHGSLRLGAGFRGRRGLGGLGPRGGRGGVAIVGPATVVLAAHRSLAPPFSGRVRVVVGPWENRSRSAVDSLAILCVRWSGTTSTILRAEACTRFTAATVHATRLARRRRN